jgi:sortase A
MGTEAGAMPLLALCLGLLLALTLGVVAARQRFSAALVWVVTTPVVLAVAWVTTDVVVRLLPNLM